MNKNFKRFTAIVLSVAVLVSVLVFTGASIEEKETVAAIDLAYGDTYTFGFDNITEYKANTDSATDAEGNLFYPWRSADGNATAKYAAITYGEQEISALELSSSGKAMYIPTDEKGQPLLIDPNASYKVDITSYVKAMGQSAGIYAGGGIYEAHKAAYSDGGEKTFSGSVLWNNASTDLTAAYPVFSTNTAYTSDVDVYAEDYTENNVTLYFNTGDFDAKDGSFKLKASDGKNYSFSNYFGIYLDLAAVTMDEYSGNSLIYIDSISVTKTAGMDIGESYTFDFDSVKEATTNTTAFIDGEGNTFYPLHSDATTASASGENIEVTLADSGTKTVSALRFKSSTATQYIPTDENGLPFVLEPNTKYTVEIEGYIQFSYKNGKIFAGGGSYLSDQAAYEYHKPSGETALYYIDGTYRGNANKSANYSVYPMYRATEYLGNGSSSTADFRESGFSQANASQYKTASHTMLTTDFKEVYAENATIGTNHFNPDMWYKGQYATDADPYTTEGVEILNPSVGAYFTLNCIKAGSIYYIDRITITKVSQTASVTYDACGGAFSDGETTKTVTENVGGAFSVGSPSTESGLEFRGWSLTKGGSIAVADVDASLHGKTLFAIWSEPSPHPDDGSYDAVNNLIEFDKYEVTEDNTYIENKTPYFNVIDDPDEAGDKLLHYYNWKGASEWYANWSITPTVDGVSSTESGLNGGQVLTTDSDYRLTMRVRINDTDGSTADVAMFYGSSDGRHSYDKKSATGLISLTSGLTETGDFITLTFNFTTPSEYAVTSDGLPKNRFFVGIKAPEYKLDYDLDYIKLEKVTTTDLYIKENGKYVLHRSLEGIPGTDLNLGKFYSAENYAEDAPVGNYTKTLYGNWFADENCTEAPVMKYGNYDVDLYCDYASILPSVSTENQELFVGFDTYTQRTEGLVGAEISDDSCNTGSFSLKAAIATGESAAFELKNDYTFDLLDGKTYRVDFAYKTDKEATLDIGLAKGLVANGVDSKNSILLKATDDWTVTSVIFTADGVSDNSVLAAKVTTVTGATVYIDTMIVSSATESVGVEAVETDNGEGLRFMLSYSGDTVQMAGMDYVVTEHGVIVKGQDVDTALTLENKDEAGIFHFAQTDISKNWSVNPITGTTVYSAYLDGFDEKDDYKVSVRGYVKLSDGTVYYTDTLTASAADIPAAADIIPENADLTNYYVYLPEGTILPDGKEYTVTTYDNTFAANSAIENNVVTVGSYGIFSARPDFSKINVPSDLKYLVHAGTKDELYYGLNAHTVSAKLSEVGKDTVNYLFITDIHFGNNLTSAQSVSLLNQAKLMTKIANENDDIDFVVIGGDITTGMYSSKADCIKWTQAALDPFLACQKPVFVLMGNHDDNSYHLLSSSNTTKTLYPERIITDLDWQNYIIDRYTNKGNIQVVQDDPSKRSNSKYFYYDLDGKKTRIIALDALDYEAKYDENGYVLGDLNNDGLLDGMPIRTATAESDREKYQNGTKYWGYSADQVRWLAEDALGTLPSDYDVIFVSHMGIDKTTNTSGTSVRFGNDVRSVVKAFEQGGTYTASLMDNWGTAVSVNADFKDKNGRSIIWQFGHQHTELSLYQSDIDLWQLCTSSANVGQTELQTYEKLAASNINSKTLPWRVYTRKLGSSTEACFNLMSVSDERVYRLTVGQGSNEKLIYPY